MSQDDIREDDIILAIIREQGCNVPTDLTSLKDLAADPALFFHVASVCLTAVRAGRGERANYPTKLPGGKAQQFRIGTSMADDVKQLGYSSELGYEAFLYPVEGTLKKLLRFLVDKLPKESDGQGADESVAGAGVAGVGLADVKKVMTAWTQVQWNPLAYHGSHARPSVPVHSVPLSVPSSTPHSKEAASYYSKHQPLVSLQPRSVSSLAPSVLSLHTLELIRKEDLTDEFDRKARNAESVARIRGLVKGAFGAAIRAREQYMAASRGADLSDYASAAGGAGGARSAFGRKQAFENEEAASIVLANDASTAASTGQSAEEREAQLRAEREKQLADLQAQLDELLAAQRAADARADELASQSRQMESELAAALESSSELEGSYMTKKQTLDLLPDAANNLRQLQQLVADSSARLLSLASEWETHRVPLVSKLRRAREELAERKAEMSGKIEAIRRLREEMKEKATDLREKEKLARILADELNALPKSINRQVYVRRIMDLMKNIDKQKASIRAVLADVRAVQKDINLVSEASRRSFAVADEVVFQAAKLNPKDEAMTKTYKYVVHLREGFVELVAGVEAKGRAENDIRALQAQIDDVESRNSSLNTERIEADLKQVKAENKSMAAKIKAAAK